MLTAARLSKTWAITTWQHVNQRSTHYVRSGDSILALLSDAQETKQLNDYAFALGALAHYASDIACHPIATNRAVRLLYPKLKTKFGDSVTYENDPLAHVKTEFGFDVLEIAQQRCAPESYHDFPAKGPPRTNFSLTFPGSSGGAMKSDGGSRSLARRCADSYFV